MALKITISNNRDNREYTSELFKDGVFPLGAYKYLVNMVSDFYATGAVITIRVNPDVLDGNIF